MLTLDSFLSSLPKRRDLLVKQQFSYHPQLNKWLRHLPRHSTGQALTPPILGGEPVSPPTLGGDKEGVFFVKQRRRSLDSTEHYHIVLGSARDDTFDSCHPCPVKSISDGLPLAAFNRGDRSGEVSCQTTSEIYPHKADARQFYVIPCPV